MDINEVKDVVLSTLGQAVDGAKGLAGKAAEGAKGFAGTVADKAKSGGSIVKLSMDVATARENLKKTYLEIGKLYYETHKDTQDEAFARLFDEIRETEELIAAKEAELAGHKDNIKEKFTSAASAAESEDVIDFAEVVAQAEAEAEAAMADAEPQAGEDAAEDAGPQAGETAAEDAEQQAGETAAEDAEQQAGETAAEDARQQE